MLPITELKMLSKLELARLLERCATLMNAAYQETLIDELCTTAGDAKTASDVLHYEHLITTQQITLH